MRAWVAIALLTGCGRLRFDDRRAGDGALGSDSVRDTAHDAPPCTFGTWATPAIQSAVNAGGATDWGPSMTNDRLVLVFSSDRSDGSTFEIYIAQRSDAADPWPTPTVALVGGASVLGGDPQITDDGLTLMWTANGVIEASIRASRSDTWTDFHTFIGDGQLYTGAQAPSLSPDGRNLYFTATARDTGMLDMFVTTRQTTADGFPEPTHIPGLDDSKAPQFGSVDAAGLDLVFQQSATYAVFEATRATTTDSFGTAAIPPQFTSLMPSVDSSISSDGTALWFSSSAMTGDYDLFMTTRPCT